MNQQSSLGKSARNGLMGAVVALTAAVVFLQAQIDPLRMQPAIEPPQAKKALTGLGSASLPFEYTLGAASGFRQVIAGLLWVRSDSFFHSGNYDAILPMIRMITWLDPNWLDPYATGAWHLTYNFTDTDQRSDRRYLPAGVALLNEGISNNPDLYDMYKEKGWLYYDKFKDFHRSAEAYEGGMQNNPDITQVGHALAHAYERAGKIDEAEKAWENAIALHKKNLEDARSSPELKSRSDFGIKNATGNLERLRARRKWRKEDIFPPVDARLTYKITRVKPRVIEVSGTMNLVGAKGFDIDNGGVVVEGPVDGVRCEVQLQDRGYSMPPPREFVFDLPPDVTLMKDSISIKGGRQVKKGGVLVVQPRLSGYVDQPADKAGVYGFKEDEVKKENLAIPLDKALNQLTPAGQRQIVSVAYPLGYNSRKPIVDVADVPGLFQKLKGDSAKIAELTKKGYAVATKDFYAPAEFKREIDMSKDPKMYGFQKGEYQLILWVNPRHAPDFFKDRVGFSGEGLTDSRFGVDFSNVTDDSQVTTLSEDQQALYNVSKARGAKLVGVVINLKKEDLLGSGKAVIAESK